MTDQLEKLFADLRTETLAELRPPGVQAARRTVRRRRTAASAGAGLAVLAVLGGVVFGLPRSSPPANPPMSPGAARKAAEAVGLDLSAPVLGGVLAPSTTTTQQVISGSYEARLACVGTGRVTATLETSSGDVLPVVVTCTPPGLVIVTRPLAVAGTLGSVNVGYVPDASAAGRSVVAYRLSLTTADTEKLQHTAAGAFDARPPGRFVSSLGEVLDNDENSTRDGTIRPGPYRAYVACAGAGTAELILSAVSKSDSDRLIPLARVAVGCAVSPMTTSVDFTIPENAAHMLDVRWRPAPRAWGQAATLVRIERA